MANFAFSDLHGNLDAWRAIQERTSPSDRLFCLGDVADRGPDGYLMLREILADPRITYIKGNHDDLFVNGVLENDHENFIHWVYRCGGQPTFDGWRADGCPIRILEKLRSTPTREVLVTKMGLMLLSHAGYTPRKVALTSLSDDDFLWDRDHFSDPWELGARKIFVVHGHTPVDCGYFGRVPIEPHFYCEGHKVCIDLGTYRTDVCALLNLDNLEYEVIRV